MLKLPSAPARVVVSKCTERSIVMFIRQFLLIPLLQILQGSVLYRLSELLCVLKHKIYFLKKFESQTFFNKNNMFIRLCVVSFIPWLQFLSTLKLGRVRKYSILKSYLEVVQDDDVRNKVKHVLFSTAKRHLDQVGQVGYGWPKNVTHCRYLK